MSQLYLGRARITENASQPLTAYEVVADVVQSNQKIDSVTLVTYDEGPSWRDLREAGPEDTEGLLRKGILQDLSERILIKLPRDEVFAENLRSIAQGLNGKRLLGLVSKVGLAGEEFAHIPMMDFMCIPSGANLELLSRLLRNLHQGQGYVLESGRSYHYYAFQLLGEEEWRRFLGKCLLMSGYTDDRYIGHQLIDGHCVLRLSSGNLKARVPTVAANI